MTKRDITKVSRKRYNPAVVAMAHDMYIRDETYQAIADKVSSVTGRATTIMTVFGWVKKYKWADDKTKHLAQALEEVNKDNVIEILANKTTEQIGAYNAMWRRGLEKLAVIDPKNAAEAVEMIDKGIRGERQITMGVIALRLLEGIARIIREEVNDSDTCARIGTKLKAYVVESATAPIA